MVNIRNKIKMMSLSTLIEHDKNNKDHPQEQIDILKQNILKFGFTSPFLISGDNKIIAGHGRKLACNELGIKEVPCIIIDDLSEEEIKALRIADNRVGELGETNWAFVKEEWEELKDSGLDFLTGYKEEDFLDMIEEQGEVEEDDFEAPDDINEIETDIKLGDVFKLGEHRLMCGSSTEKEDVDKLLDGNKCELCFTDPPYGMKKENEGVLNDNLNYDDLLEFNKKWIKLSFNSLTDVGSWYCWGIDEPLMDIYSEILKPMIKDNKATFRNLLTWDKTTGQGQMSEEFRMYAPADEKCLFVMKGVQNYYDERLDIWDSIRLYMIEQKELLKWTGKQINNILLVADTGGGMANHYFSNIVGQWIFPTKEKYILLQQEAKGKAFKKEYDEIKKEYDEIKKEYYSTRAYFNNTHDNMNNVWHFDRTGNTERETTGGHATPKPLELCSRAIKSSSRDNNKVLDLFGGSGSTLIACEQLNRKCYMMELDERYCNTIINRFNKLNPTAEIKCLNRDFNIMEELK